MNFRKLCRIACVFLFLMFLQGNALAATIHGTVYEWYSFEPLNDVVVEINSTPEQYVVATNSEYSFNLTPGTYLINATYFEENEKIYQAREEVVISDDGDYVHDLLLFPLYEEELLNQNDFEVSDLGFEELEPVSQANSRNIFIASALLAFIILLLAGYFLRKRYRKSPEIIARLPRGNGEIKALQPGDPIKEAEFSEEVEANSAEDIAENSEANFETSAAITQETGNTPEIGKFVPQTVKSKEGNQEEGLNTLDSSVSDEGSNKTDVLGDPETNLPEDLKELLDVIQASGNRITQRELRKKSPYSESKVSLMLSDLEERGLVEKFKRGRGNIIRIPDEHVSKQTGNESKKE